MEIEATRNNKNIINHHSTILILRDEDCKIIETSGSLQQNL